MVRHEIIDNMISKSRIIPIPPDIRCKTDSRSRPATDTSFATARLRNKTNRLTARVRLEPETWSLELSYLADELIAKAAAKFGICRRHCGCKFAAVYVFGDLHARLSKPRDSFCFRRGCKLT